MADMESAFEDLQLDVLAKSRQERLKEHCVKMTDALLYRSEPLKDVCFKCSDDEFQFAHKFVLGTQCQCVAPHRVPSSPSDPMLQPCYVSLHRWRPGHGSGMKDPGFIMSEFL